ncbi:hypothetical protein BT93_L1772 [Corymbia citriodora subsp. variegata]|nr:hypothetical protein BT93_L1772 [Corymbia citriodora subsp. variegata]
MEAEAEAEELAWRRETIPKVMKLVCTRLPQRDLVSLLLVSPWLHRTLVSYPSLWQPRYRQVKKIDFEFAQDIGQALGVPQERGNHRYSESLKSLETLNLNGCQKISYKGIAAVTSCCPNLKVFSIYWNVQVTDIGIKHLVENCRHLVDLNLSGCKNITDKSLELVADSYNELESLNLTRRVKLTDIGLRHILFKCSALQSLNLYALSSLTDNAYNNISSLSHLKYLDLCGAQNLSDDTLSCIAKCRKLVALNLTW